MSDDSETNMLIDEEEASREFTSNSWPKWEVLRRFGNSYLVRASVIMPLLGYFILFNDEIVRFIRLDILLGVDARTRLDGTQLMNIRFVYFGLFFLGVGSAVYSVFCPEIIKNHNDSTAYVRADYDLMSYKDIRDILDTMSETYPRYLQFKKLRGQLDRDRTQVSFVTMGSNQPGRQKVESELWDRREIYIRAMKYYYNVARRLSPTAFWFSFGLFSIGVILLAIPSITLFLRILRSTLESAS